MKYQWVEGSRPPKGVSPQKVAEAIEAMPPTSRNPKELVKRAKAARHALHRELWGESDAVWAQRGREERARHIMASLEVVQIIGGKTITFRAVEYVRRNEEDGWFTTGEILADDDLKLSYMEQVEKLLRQAQEKQARATELFRLELEERRGQSAA